MTVAAEIRAELARQKIPAAVLAQALGVTKQALSRKLSKEKSDFGVAELKIIGDYLNVSPSDFFTRAEYIDSYTPRTSQTGGVK